MSRRRTRARADELNPHPWRNDCVTHKLAFRHKDTAELSARMSNDHDYRVYRCELCNLWHITSQPYDPTRRRR